ncbi:helix-turn-helix transcriptional regulator [Angustibacter aerolatus]
MPTTAAATTSQRLLSLLSLLQTRRDWPGGVLAERLSVTERTVRRDVDRLRELGYPVQAVRGPAGGYRLGAGSQMPPLLLDDEQTVALAVALRLAVTAGAGIEEAAERALTTLRQVVPARLRGRIDTLELSVAPPSSTGRAATDVLLAVGAAVRAREELRFRYPAAGADPDDEALPTRRVQPHHLVARAGRWYLVGWDVERDDWRVFRVDRVRPRVPNGPRFTPRPLPGGDVAAFLEGRFRGASGPGGWPCVGTVLLQRPAADGVRHVGDGVVEASGPKACRVRLGAWSWAGLAASFARFDADVEVLDPPQLRDAFAVLARRASRAAGDASAE